MKSAEIRETIDGLHGDLPCTVAARRVLDMRLQVVERWLASATSVERAPVRAVHQLRVATRRAAAALRVFKPFLPRKLVQAGRALLREIRSVAAAARQDDVHAEALRDDTTLTSHEFGRRLVLTEIDKSRAAGQKALAALDTDATMARVRELRKRIEQKLQKSAHRHAGLPAAAGQRKAFVLTELAACSLPELVTPLAAAELTSPEAFHELRLAGKRLRYSLEILGSCLPPEFMEVHYPRIEAAQARLGAINDAHELAERVAALLPMEAVAGANGSSDLKSNGVPDAQRAALVALRDEFRYRSQRLQRDFLAWWETPEVRTTVGALTALLPTERTRPGVGRLPRMTHAVLHRLTEQRVRNGQAPYAALEGGAHPHRIAALDVGSNSIRMVVAETDPQNRFRIIEDVRETTRLAGGLHRSKRISRAAFEAALAALGRMRKIAEEHHVDRLRAIGTSALREAKNASRFVREARDRAGILIEPIAAEYEARLAFASVSRAFPELASQHFAMVDLGGGSAEVVISTGGLIEAVHPLRLGAVRLTDRFCDATNPGVYDFPRLRRYVRRTLEKSVAGHRPTPLLVGTGGTFTTLARISIKRGAAQHSEGRFPFAVRGYEIEREEVRDILNWLRKMSHASRRNVPGLSDRRSEIIVAGLCVVESLLEVLDCATLRIHDGGIRDGLLMEMIDELHLLAHEHGPRTNDVRVGLAAVRRLAELSEYEQPHSEHVARLAVRIFDQLAAQAADRAAAWTRPEARDLLQAAAILHDIGVLIDYRRHHRHSYAMITHADLAPLSRRQVELIANIARYHRKSGPSRKHSSFVRLSNDDQRLVCDLAGILRVADALDRPHTQNIADVVVRSDRSRIRFEVAGRGDLRENLAAAVKKSDVFVKAFGAAVEFAARAGSAPAAGRDTIPAQERSHVFD